MTAIKTCPPFLYIGKRAATLKGIILPSPLLGMRSSEAQLCMHLSSQYLPFTHNDIFWNLQIQHNIRWTSHMSKWFSFLHEPKKFFFWNHMFYSIFTVDIASCQMFILSFCQIRSRPEWILELAVSNLSSKWLLPTFSRLRIHIWRNLIPTCKMQWSFLHLSFLMKKQYMY